MTGQSFITRELPSTSRKKFNRKYNLFGISIRYYGLLWAIGIFFAYIVVHYQYRDKKIDEKKFEPLFFYCFFGILIGARLGHSDLGSS